MTNALARTIDAKAGDRLEARAAGHVNDTERLTREIGESFAQERSVADGELSPFHGRSTSGVRLPSSALPDMRNGKK